MFSKDEHKILKMIMYTPVIIVVIYTTLVSLYLYYEHDKNLKEYNKNFTKFFIENEKKRIKNTNKKVFNYIQDKDINSYVNLKKHLKIQMQNIYQNIDGIYTAYKDTKSKEEIIEIIKSALRGVRFHDGRSYVSLTSVDYKIILHPLKIEEEGKNNYNLQDSKSKFFMQDIHDLAVEKKEGFITYYYSSLLDEKNEKKKLSYVKLHEDLGIIIILGEYLDDYKKNIQEEVLEALNKLIHYNNEHITIVSEEGEYLVYKDIKRLGKNISKIKDDPYAAQSFDKLKEAIHKGDGYSSYKKMDEDNSKQIFTKISHALEYKPWKWIIISGFYLEDANTAIEKNKNTTSLEYQERIKNTVIVGLVILIVLLVIAYFFSNYVKKIFDTYKHKMNSYLRTNIKQKNILKNAQETAHIGNWELDIKTHKAYWSTETIKIFGFENTKEKFSPELLKTIIHKDDVACFSNSINNAMLNHKKHKCIYRINRLDGKMKWIDCRGTLSKDGRKVIGTVQDITELKEKDELIRTQSRHAAMGEMLSMIAHQWRQPLSVISMDANNMLLDMALDDFDEMKARKYCNGILISTKHLSKTIDDFRNFFKPDKDLCITYVSHVLSQTQNIVGKSITAHKIKLTIKDTSISKVNVYQRELMQVFVNIINNAIDALVQSDNTNKEINISIFDEKEDVVTKISNNGIKIPKNIMDKIFDPYFSTKDEQSGTGLGLYMSKVIIENHLEGKLEVQSSKKETSFIIKLEKSAI